MREEVLFIGDINVDLIFGGLESSVQEDKEIMADIFFRTMGSSAVISSVAYSSLGGQANLCGLVGNDDNGSYMLKALDEFGIGRSLVSVDKKTPTGVTVNLIYGQTRSQVTYPGTIAKFKGPELSETLSLYRHVHFSGIYQQKSFLPHIVPTMKYLKKLGVSISLDTQWDTTEKWKYLDEIYPFLDYLFINKDEALSIAGVGDVPSALEFFAEKVSISLIKLGHKGVCYFENNQARNIPSYPAKIIDTTGAGDAFAGGFLYAIYVGKSGVLEAVHYASAVAARNCEFHGGVGARSTDMDIQKKLMEGKYV